MSFESLAASAPAGKLYRVGHSHICDREWTFSGPSLEGTNLEAIRAAYSMEQRLEAAVGSTVPMASPRPQPWRVAERMIPLARAWVAGQLQGLIDWSDRIEESEDWRPVQAPRSCAR